METRVWLDQEGEENHRRPTAPVDVRPWSLMDQAHKVQSGGQAEWTAVVSGHQVLGAPGSAEGRRQVDEVALPVIRGLAPLVHRTGVRGD